jgi:hypothetical protein
MNDTTLAQQMVAAAPAATCNVSFHKEHEGKLHSGAGVGIACVGQFILGQTDIRDCVSFLIKRDNVS